ncbi:D-alanine--D-alanine ligase [Bacillus horti]|uniref:D-alanine--D-alanine ligase n=1 Tax=Caldalkalibacillus horti TaxID=77523 RepID=A0ABT9W0K0_9BACI|nr:D-alanine--D-alanine ligase [Bacillus horti]MDQ0166752.1 D-alanine-D-alanine ligase [Bacillus horti]
MSQKQTIGLIYGGKSSEHEVSLLTAFSVTEAINYEKYDVLPLYIKLDGTWVRGKKYSTVPEKASELRLDQKDNTTSFVSLFDLAQELDVAFPVIHGPFGEDGTLQGLLEMLDIPYVGSGVVGSALAMDKVMMKNIFSSAGLPQCNYLSYTRKELKQGELEKITQQIEDQLGYPCFVKPVNLGSSVGISKAKNMEELEVALLTAASYDNKVIVEEMIDGREVEIGVLGNDELQTSVVGEIKSVNEFYDYASKYKNIGTELVIPAQIPNHVTEQITEIAKKAFTVLECSGLSRVDFFWNPKDDQVILNEINTMPGFTPYSMYPLLFKAAGTSYPMLIEKLIELGLERYAEKKQNQITAESL